MHDDITNFLKLLFYTYIADYKIFYYTQTGHVVKD